MGLDDRPLAVARALVEEARRAGRARDLPPAVDPVGVGGGGRSPILRTEAAVELGAPAALSLALLLCDEEPGRIDDGRATLVGPELDAHVLADELGAFGLVLVVGAEPSLDPLLRATELRDALYAVALPGVMLRWLPSQGRLWCRVSRQALDGGVRCGLLARALAAAPRALPWVRGVEVAVLTERGAVAALGPALEESLAVFAALRRMQAAPAMDCASCDSAALCAAIAELRQVHERLAGGNR
jgi:CO dehydrogenase/acetyl-CoA synthase beta subunit